jgi:hypothetical protein
MSSGEELLKKIMEIVTKRSPNGNFEWTVRHGIALLKNVSAIGWYVIGKVDTSCQ